MSSEFVPSIKKKIWEGKIPVSFQLAALEVNQSNDPGLLYMMLPRNAYLTMFSDMTKNFFQLSMDLSKKDELWFEFNGKPLRWHYPCGVLFDMLCDKTDLPWNVTVHFQNFPDDVLIRCPCEEVIESHFMTMLKEADQLRNKGSVISNMSKNQHKQLWHGLKTDSFDEFWGVDKELMNISEQQDTSKFIPLRIYYQSHVIQKLFPPTSDGSAVILKNVLSVCLPEIFCKNLSQQAEVLVHGVKPPMCIPLSWLSQNLSYADNFLHICVRT